MSRPTYLHPASKSRRPDWATSNRSLMQRLTARIPMRRIKVTQNSTRNRQPAGEVSALLGDTKMDSTVRLLGIELEDALRHRGSH